MTAQTMQVESLSFARNDKTVLNKIDLEIKKGEVLGLIGPNGAGKSTFIKLLMKLLKPTKGRILLEGKTLVDFKQQALAKRLAYLPQSLSAETPFTCLDVVLMGRYAGLKRFESLQKKDLRIAKAAMAQTETAAFATKSITELSGGELQRVLLARALAQGADYLFLDEPTANLDPHYQLALLELVASLAKKKVAVILAIHDLNLAARYCHRLVLIHKGTILADGPPEKVLIPSTLQSVYGIEASVFRHQTTGQLCVLPLRIKNGNKVETEPGLPS